MPTTHYLFLHPGVLQLGEPHHRITVFSYICTCAWASNSACTRACANDTATPLTGTDGYAMQPGVTRAATRSQVRSSAGTDYRANRNKRAALAGLCHKNTVQQVQKLGSPKVEYHANLDIGHQPNDTLSTENDYAITNTRKRFGGEAKRENPQHLQMKEAMDVPQASRGKAASDKGLQAWRSTASTT